MQALDERVGCLEPPRAGHVGVQHDRLDVGGVDVGPSDLGVAEPVEREAALEDLDAGAGEGEGGGRLRVAQGTDAELAVFEHLGVADGQGGAGGAGRPDPQASDEVLPEVEDASAGGRRDHLGDREGLGAAHRRRDPRLGDRHVLVLGERGGADADRCPTDVDR